MKVAFLDRDDTIIRDYPDTDWKYQTVPEFLPQSIEALQLIQAKGYTIIIVTNQYLIDEGYITLQDYQAFDMIFQELLKKHNIEVLQTFYCPDARGSGSYDLKPNPGMIKQALALYPDIDLANSFVVGDSLADVGLAENMQLPIYIINQDVMYHKATKVSSLYEVAKRL